MKMREHYIQKFLDTVDSTVLGIFWITDSPLSPNLPQIKEMDYLSNGQLSQHFKRDQGVASLHSKNIFIQKSFGQDFFICHLHHNPAEVKDSMNQIKSLVENVHSSRKKLLLLNCTSYDYLKTITSLFSHSEIVEFSV